MVCLHWEKITKSGVANKYVEAGSAHNAVSKSLSPTLLKFMPNLNKCILKVKVSRILSYYF